MRRKVGFLVAIALLGAALPLQAWAVSFTLNVCQTFSSPAPCASAPGGSFSAGNVQLNITDAGSGNVLFEIFNNVDTSQPGSFLTQLVLDYAGVAPTTGSITNFTVLSGSVGTPSLNFGTQNVSSISIDLEFQFPTSNQGSGAQRFNRGESVRFVLDAGTALDDDSFVFAMAHIQGLANGASARIVPGTTPVPEPTTVLLTGLGLIGLGLVVRRKL